MNPSSCLRMYWHWSRFRRDRDPANPFWSRLLNLAKPKTKPRKQGRERSSRGQRFPSNASQHPLPKEHVLHAHHRGPHRRRRCPVPAVHQTTMTGTRVGGGGGAPLLVGDGVAPPWRERCPGCRQQRRVQATDRIPYADFLYIWIACLCAGMNAHASSLLHAHGCIWDVGLDLDIRSSSSEETARSRWPSLTVEN